ncbi:CLUMA_CG003916, isoform A [Clunio marinus]|uniref:CLUMA_CG003916, isoform A n=1 Tax=Clunio marinus TaxID=568069 RepID=A0A1J1HRP8_9DIPT|nr:CLUMA_CG003916, isoform A [Clunio marinus]
MCRCETLVSRIENWEMCFGISMTEVHITEEEFFTQMTELNNSNPMCKLIMWKFSFSFMNHCILHFLGLWDQNMIHTT